MNPLTNMKNVVKLSEQELKNTSQSSWHNQYKDSAWIFIGGLPFDLTEGDIICIFSQYGEVVNINLIRAKDTGKSKGFCFLCYEDQRSTILAVDNFNGIKILKRTIRVDHVQDYKVPKEGKKTDEETKKLYAEGCAPKPVTVIPKIETPKQDLRETLADQIEGELKLPLRLPIYTNIKSEKSSDVESEKNIKQEKKEKKKKKKSKKKSQRPENNTDDSDSERNKNNLGKKREKDDIKSSSEESHKIKKGDRNGSRESKKERDSAGSSKNFLYKSDKHSSSRNYDSSNRRDEKSSSKRSDRSRSRDRSAARTSHKRDISPSIPSRWR